MGNRAVIIQKGKEQGVYQHWNGGRDSIEPILYYAKNFLNNVPEGLFENNLKKFAFISMCCDFRPEYSNNYNWLDCDNRDNGTYVINDNLEIVDRKYFEHGLEQNTYNMADFLVFIDECMPKNMQKGKEHILKYLSCKEPEKIKVFRTDYNSESRDIVERVDFEEINNRLEVGDVIYYRNKFFTIIGKNDSEELTINGTDRANKVFFNYTENYDKENSFCIDSNDPKGFENLKTNPNAYLSYTYCEDVETGKTIKVLEDSNFKIVDKDKYEEYKKVVDQLEA